MKFLNGESAARVTLRTGAALLMKRLAGGLPMFAGALAVAPAVAAPLAGVLPLAARAWPAFPEAERPEERLSDWSALAARTACFAVPVVVVVGFFADFA
jgi:hypothetical protein